MDEAEALAARIDRFREAGRPVPLVLEQRLLRIKNGRKARLPKHARCGFKTDKERDSLKIAKRFAE